MHTTRVPFTFNFLIKMLGMNMQERIKLAYTAALAQVPRLFTYNTQNVTIIQNSVEPYSPH